MENSKEENKERYYENLYYESSEAGRNWQKDPSREDEFNKAMKGYEEIIAGPEDLPVRGGTYVNWANLETHRLISTNANEKYDFLIPISRKIEDYYGKALEIKPTNEQAMQGLGIYYFAIQQFEASYSYYNQLSDPQAKSELLNYYLRSDINYGYYQRGNNLEALNNPSRIRFYERLYKDYKDGENIGIGMQTAYLLVHYYEVSKQHQESYDLMNELLEGPGGDEFKIVIYEKLARLCKEGVLNKTDEVAKYAKAGLDLLAARTPGEDPQVDTGLKQTEEFLKSHLG